MPRLVNDFPVKILVATTNRSKLAEVADLLKDLPLEIALLSSLAGWPEVVENGRTFEENARKKARALAEFSGVLTLADDSGLEVDALGGAPGLFSARYSGTKGDDYKNNERLLRELAGVPEVERGARFVCVIALCAPGSAGGGEWFFRGECRGRIVLAPRGENGFGYDPLFLYPPLGKTFAELDQETKGRVSHRGKALAALKEALPRLIPLEGKPRPRS